MPQGRILLKRISESKRMPQLNTNGARLLYTWLIPHVDVNGCYSADPEVIKGKVFTKLHKSTKSIAGYLQDLADVGSIILYTVNGENFLYIPDFVEKQPYLNPDKEAKTTIPPPTPDQLQTNSGVTPLKVKEKVKEKVKKKSNTTIIFEKWNSYRKKGKEDEEKKWRYHPKLSYEIEQAILEQLKHYSVEDLCGAIENYARVLLFADFTWSYAWTLQQFLTRTLPNNRSEKQLWRFLPNNYHDEDYLTDSSKTQRIKKRKEFYGFIRDCEEQKLIAAYKENKNNLNWLIDELRPEIKKRTKQ